MDGRRVGFVVLMCALLLAGCTSSVDISSSSSAAAGSVSATRSTAPGSESGATSGWASDTPAYVPFSVLGGPPSGSIAPVFRAETGGVGANVTPPLTFAWAKTGSVLYVTTRGSQTCPEVVDRVTSTGAQSLSLHTSRSYGGIDVSGGKTTSVCTADMSPTTSTVPVPPDMDPTQPVLVTMNGSTYRLPGR